MSQQLTSAEKFILLAHRYDRAGYYNSHQIVNIGLTGAILLDLANEKALEVRNKKVEILRRKTELTPAHQDILNLIQNSQKRRSIKRWISRITNKGGRFRKQVLRKLESDNLFTIENKKFLGIPFIAAKLLNVTVREDLIKDLRGVVFDMRKPYPEHSSLLSLLRACSLYKVLCQNSSERRTCKKNLKKIAENNEIAGSVDQVVQEMQAAIVAATIATTTAATVSSN